MVYILFQLMIFHALLNDWNIMLFENEVKNKPFAFRWMRSSWVIWPCSRNEESKQTSVSRRICSSPIHCFCLEVTLM